MAGSQDCFALVKEINGDRSLTFRKRKVGWGYVR